MQVTISIPAGGAYSRVARVVSNPLAKRLAWGAFWSLVSSGVAQSFGLLASIITARYLGSAEFGKLGILLSTANLFATVGAAGLGVTATKHVAEFREADPDRAGRIIGMSSVTAIISGMFVSLVLVGLAPWLARDVLAIPHLVTEIRLSAAILFFAAVNGYQIGALAGFEAFRSTAVANLIRGVGGFPFLVAGAVLFGLPGAVIANGIAAALSCAAHAYMLRCQCRKHAVRISYALRREEFRLLYRFSLPVLIAGISYTPALWASNAALARGAGYHEMGLFQVAFQWQTVSLFLTTAVANVSLPMLGASLRSRQSYLQVLAGSFTLTTALAVVAATPVFVLAPYIARPYGPQFAGVTAVIRIMCFCSVLMAANISVGNLLWSQSAAKAGMFFALLRGTVLVVAGYLLARHGAKGLANAHLLTTAVLTAAQLPLMIYLLRTKSSVAPERVSRVKGLAT